MLHWSETQFQAKLYLPRRVCGARDSPGRRSIDGGAGSGEVSRIRKIESLGPELQYRVLANAELFGQSHGHVAHVIRPEYAWAGIAVGVVGGYGETTLVEPGGQRRLMHPAGAGAHRPLSSNPRIGHSARDGGRKGETRTKNDRTAQLPAANDIVDHAVRIAQQPPLAERQFQAVAE